MVLEIAQYSVQPEKVEAFRKAMLTEAMPIIRGAEGCRSATLRQQIEHPSVFILQIEWETLEHHTVKFRGGPLFAAYRGKIAGLYVDPIEVNHYRQVSE
ncbi:MAG TPA: antibiotic biosynthesis monooxygenase family protein [Ktedonobacterales bacterium]|jgi:quinol monooxygenase YgiN|nr:antibiotic biosynthesis monooxygenase family protein [Ktedonobacterales bacterium]